MYKEVTGKKISRRQFILQLTVEMQQMYFSASSVKNIPYQVNEPVNVKKNKRQQCQVKKCKGNKTQDYCDKCKRLCVVNTLQKGKKIVVCSLCCQ